MTGKKAFLITFVLTLSFMLTAFGGLYFLLDGKTTPADTNQPGVAIVPGVHDTRNLFIAVGDKNCSFFFTLRFNAPQSKISVVSLSPSYVYPSAGCNLSQLMEKSGVVGCVMATEEEFGIQIDNYLRCSWDDMRYLLKNFKDIGIEHLGENLPRSVKKILLKNAEMLDADSLINAVEKRQKFLDNELGLAFLNESAYLLMYTNGENLYDYTGDLLKEYYSLLDTNINTRALKDYRRIIRFLNPSTTEYIRQVITQGDTRAAEKMHNAFLE